MGKAEKSFEKAKQAIANATLLNYPIPGAKLSSWTDASSVAIGSSLMQYKDGKWEPIAVLPTKLSKSQINWSTYDRERLAISISIKRFRHMLEGRDFEIFADQKPLIYAFKQKSEKFSPRQLRHLDYISQFSTKINHIHGKDNISADTLSRIEIDVISKPTQINYKFFEKEQKEDEEIKIYKN